MRLLLDEMYPATIAEELRRRGHDVASLHEPEFRQMEGAPDREVFDLAVEVGRVLVTENVSDFRRLESEALARGESIPGFVFTTNRQFPRGQPGTVGRMVEALDELLGRQDTIATAVFLRR